MAVLVHLSQAVTLFGAIVFIGIIVVSLRGRWRRRSSRATPRRGQDALPRQFLSSSWLSSAENRERVTPAVTPALELIKCPSRDRRPPAS